VADASHGHVGPIRGAASSGVAVVVVQPSCHVSCLAEQARTTVDYTN
jgi:hypothetical protein